MKIIGKALTVIFDMPLDYLNSGAGDTMRRPMISPKSPNIELKISTTRTFTNLMEVNRLGYDKKHPLGLTRLDQQHQLMLRYYH